MAKQAQKKTKPVKKAARQARPEAEKELTNAQIVMKRNQTLLPAVLAVAFLLIVSVVCGFIFNSRSNALENQQKQISETESSIAALNAQISQKKSSVTADTTRIDESRVQADDEAAEDFLKNMFSFTSGKEYDATRTKIMKDYKLDDKSNFMKTFMPSLPKMSTADGKTSNVIDVNKLHVDVDKVTSHLSGIKGRTYTYFTEVTLHTETTDKQGSSSGKVIFMYSTDANHRLFDLDAYTVVQ